MFKLFCRTAYVSCANFELIQLKGGCLLHAKHSAVEPEQFVDRSVLITQVEADIIVKTPVCLVRPMCVRELEVKIFSLECGGPAPLWYFEVEEITCCTRRFVKII